MNRAGLVLSVATALSLGIVSAAHAQIPLLPSPWPSSEPPLSPLMNQLAPLSRVTFAAAHGERAYFLRVTSSEGAIAECFTPCNLELPAGRTHIEVVAPRAFARDVELSGRAALIRVSHFSTWRYGVGGLLLGISMAEFIYGAVYFPWTGGGEPRDAAISAVAWAFGGLELTSALTMLALGGRDRVEVIDSPARLKAEILQKSALRLAGLGAFASPSGSGFAASFRF